MGLFSTILGDPSQKQVKRIQSTIGKINDFESQLEKLSDEDLKAKTSEFKKRLNPPTGTGENLDAILPEAFAVVREASKRTLGQRHFDVQLIGGVVLHEGKIAEMRTGEGKTLMATLPLYLNALEGKGAHLVTVNDYLAKRDAAWMGLIFEKLGMSVAAIGHESSFLFDSKQEDKLLPINRQQAYAADITYGTNNEFGFDYLRDNMALDLSRLSQRPLHYVIVDEVDSILIDEARTPLIISSPAEESGALYRQFANLAKNLVKDKDYKLDEKEKSVFLTEEGMKKIEGILSIGNIYSPEHIQLVHHMEEALKAQVLFSKDRDYVVKDNEVIIVDEFTGRLMPGRRYSEGLHQAIEAKENVEIKRESDTLATISFQNFFRMYDKLSGMTGTAMTESEEFFKIYGLEVVSIPTHRPMIRIDAEDKIYKTEEAKFEAIAKDIAQRNEIGQPVLVGTISIEKSEYLSKLLKREGIKHEVLNAKHHEREAKIILNAGRNGAVTVATNMAGRGVDIVLGGNPTPKEDAIPNKEQVKDWEKEHQKVLQLGGLYVLGTERHEARRIDNQLRGRSGRQGDPGYSQFYVSLEDDLMRIFGGQRLKTLMDRLGLPEDMPIEHRLISGSIEKAQKRVEGQNFDIRKHLVEYDDVMNKHRGSIYRKRKEILAAQLDKEKYEHLHQEILEVLGEDAKKYEERMKEHPAEVLQAAERMSYLRVIDVNWVEHLNTMEGLREGIGLRGYGQRDPLVEYKKEAYELFQSLKNKIDNEFVDILMNLEIKKQENSNFFEKKNLVMQGPTDELAGGAISNLSIGMESPNPVAKSQAKIVKKVGRNDPCPCGSGKKYKKCCGR